MKIKMSDDQKVIDDGGVLYDFVEGHFDKCCENCDYPKCYGNTFCSTSNRKDHTEGFWVRRTSSVFRKQVILSEEERFLIGILL